MGRGEQKGLALAGLSLNFSRRIAARMSNVNDDKVVLSNAVVDEVRIVGRREHSNIGDVGLSS